MARLAVTEQVRTVPASRNRAQLSWRDWAIVASLAYFPLAALALWLATIEDINLRAMNDFGLVSVLPAGAFVAVGILNVSFCIALNLRRRIDWLLLLHTLVLIFMLYGVTAIIEDAPRFEAAWRHVGIIDYVVRQGSVDPTIDAYFNWPGAFVLGALLTEVAGLDNALPFIAWTPVVLNLLYLGPLLMLMRGATTDTRVPWLGVWVFYLANWIGQDYFSPQGLNLFLYLIVVGILVRWFSTTAVPFTFERRGLAWAKRQVIDLYHWFSHPGFESDVARPATTPQQRVGFLAILVLVLFVIASSHQLTPFFTIAALFALSPFSRFAVRRLPILMTVIVVAWITFMAVTYVEGHFTKLIAGVGAVDQAVGANVGDRLAGSPEHVMVVRIRLLVTLAIWGLAFLGGLRRLRAGHIEPSYVLLAAAPFPFLVLQPYGGELLLRVYLFALPPVAYFVARLFYPSSTAQRSWLVVPALVLTTLLLSAGFLTSRYGNERMDYFTTDEVAAMEYLYDAADPDSLIVTGTNNLPWKYREYELHDYIILSQLPAWQLMAPSGATATALDALIETYDTQNRDVFVIITRSADARATILGELQPGLLPQLEDSLVDSSQFTVLYANQDAVVFAPADREEP